MLVVQVDYMTMACVRYYQTKIWGTGSALDLVVKAGDEVKEMEFLTTRLPRKADIAAVAEEILQKARAAWATDDLRLLDDASREAADAVRFVRHGSAFMAVMEPASTLSKLHAKDRSAQD